jgi:predicted RNA polymerase sigma factor
MIGHDSQARDAAAATARRSYGRLVALLSARTRNVAEAEDALSEAFAAALAEWPRSGTPRNPEAWLLAVARRRSIDAARHRRAAGEAGGHLQLLAEEIAAMAEESAPIPDERLSLMFACAHPAALDTIAVDARLAEYQPYWAVRADLLARAGERAAAQEAYGQAIGLEADPAVRRFLQRRQAAV